MNKYLRFLIIGFLFFLLILVRAFSSKLFYDPFINYFKNDYLHKELPNFNLLKLSAYLFLRYILNAIISIGIIYVLFKKQLLKFSLQFYTIAFFILMFLLILILKFHPFESYLPLFYIRRFLIHPIFVLLLIPAYYYQEKHA